MHQSEKSNGQAKRPPKKGKTSRWTYGWLAFLVFAVALVSLLLYKPAGYHPIETSVDPNQPRQVHRYLTHLSSELYNGMQTQEPFVIDLLEVGLNESILQSEWPKESEGMTFAAPKVSMTPESISVVGMASYQGVDLAIVMVGVPSLTEAKKLILHIDTVRVGALNVTMLARLIARGMVEAELPWFSQDPEDKRTQIARSLLDDVPFDPLFAWEDKQVRLIDLRLEKGRVRLMLASE